MSLCMRCLTQSGPHRHMDRFVNKGKVKMSSSWNNKDRLRGKPIMRLCKTGESQQSEV